MSQSVSAAAIATDLAALIERDRWQAGDRLPTEHALCDQYGASRPTVRKALTSLLSAGMVDSSQGRGWFVRGDRRVRFPLDSIDSGFLTARDDVWHTWLSSLGREAGHRLEVRVEDPPREVVRLLGLTGAEPLAVARRRIRLIDGEPAMISTGWWPLWLASGTQLGEEGAGDAVDMRDPSPMRFAAQQGYPALREQNEIGGRMPLESEAQMLGMAVSQPLITMHTTSWTHDGRPLRCTADLFPAHAFLLTVGRDHDKDPA